MYYIAALAVSFVIVYFSVPYVQKLALRTGFVDIPNQRKIHKDPIPLLGGLAIYGGFIVTAAIFTHRAPEFWGITLGGLIIFVLGIIDDFYKTRKQDLSAWPKFLIQILAACILPIFGVSIQGVSIPFMAHGFIFFPIWLRVFTTVVWVVAITNMMNFLDGVDGLAAGIAAISATTLFFIALVKGHVAMASLSIILIGTSLGFLRHNFHPARIFMGDAGATFLGYVLAAIAVGGAFKSATLVSMVIPVFALGVPIMDAFYVIFRRFKENRPIYIADKGHTFHYLMRSGLSQKQTVTFLYLLGICFSLVSIVILLVNNKTP
ncbi:MraY family glycosyltransferase [Sulfoacidibacillus thermotolerans]|uniref:Undecaprenyl-phosphate alpha-N-acetylglucosaminyl 1-phosphate transferase n=1 Tax=Sulfoacidibacillus thermotolerans TaxID=1765684 RepID=A0A2U3D7J0_SULT2|nr:MraY family glycosyltransferase [Sulfoacidibacillus thermotolerans]PWI57256.1 undecaprenyl-phosphate alpha-N-acetylglucosaminyl 1-phosphate transferase [Sulfoacidibacillus thermotolerans]